MAWSATHRTPLHRGRRGVLFRVVDGRITRVWGLEAAVEDPALSEALTGRFTDHHAFLARLHLDLIDQHTAAIEELTAQIEVVIEPFQGFRDLICTIPGMVP
jgi:hypothetical protein